MTSVELENAKEEANKAFDEHCRQWNLLQKIQNPTVEQMEKWLTAKKSANIAQDKFEIIVRQIYG